MQPLKKLSVIFVSCLVVLTACQKEIQSDELPNQQSLLNEKNAATKSTARTFTVVNEKLAKLRATLPAGYEKRLQHSSALLLKQHPEYRNLVNRALAVEPSECNAVTPVNQWLNNELSDWTDEVINLALITGILNFPMYDALLFENSSANQYYGVNGEFSHSITKGFKDLKRFWNIQSADMVLGAMHGSMLTDRERVIKVDMAIYGDSKEDAEFWADIIVTLMDIVPQYRKGNHPIFTFNAFAMSKAEIPPFGIVPSKIIMGDGIVQGLSNVGYDDVAAQAILAHEFGHHIQFQLGLLNNGSGTEATRRSELMADAYAAYYLSHAKGASLQWKRVKQFLDVFFNIGDCSFNDGNHHGTPAQRMAAAEWGYSIANNAQKQGHILTSQEFTTLFEAQLPVLVQQ